MTDRPHWSYSALNQFLRCPLQYYFRRVLGLPSQTTRSGLVLGSSVHAALAAYHSAIQRHETIPREQLISAFQNTWAEREAAEAVIYKDGETRDDTQAQGISLVELYLKEPPPENVIAVEQSFLVPLFNSHGEYLETPLIAIVDLITAGEDDTWKVTEFKTSGRAYGESEVATSLQPTCYVHAIAATFGRAATVEYAVLVKTKTPKLQRLKTARYDEDSGRLGDMIQTVERAIQLNVFYPIESPMNCSTCPYRQPCRDWGRNSKPVEAFVPLEELRETATCSPS